MKEETLDFDLTEDIESHISSIKYYWQEKEDLERYSDFEDAKPILEELYPEVLKAWNDYKRSKKILNNIISRL